MADVPKAHIMFIFEKWCDQNPQAGLSSSFENFSDPLSAHALATFEVIHPDEQHLANNNSWDNLLIDRCQTKKPDLIFWVYGGLIHDYCHPKPATLFKLRIELGIPIAIFLPDAQSQNQITVAEVHAPYLDFIVHALSPQQRELSSAKYIRIPHPKDPRIFHDPHRIRDIDLCFAGSCTNRPARINLLQFLTDNGIEVTKVGGQREQRLSSTEFAEILQRSKISLNIMDYEGPAMNGRVMESTLCGALLLNSDNSEVDRFLVPGRDFMQFDTREGALAKIKYLLANETERAQIAAHGHQKAVQLFDGRHFWETILGQLNKPSGFRPEEAWLARASYLDNLGSTEQAILAFKNSIASNSEYEPVLVLYAKLLIRLKRFSEAQELLVRCLGLANPQVEAFLSLALAYRAQGNLDGVLATAKAGAAKFTEVRDLAQGLALGKLYLVGRDYHGATSIFALSLKSVQGFWQGAVGCAGACFADGRVTEASAIVEQLCKLVVPEREVLAEFKDVAEILGDQTFDGWAKERYRPTNPQHCGMLTSLAFIEERLGKLDKALAILYDAKNSSDFANYPYQGDVLAKIAQLEATMA